MLPQHFRFVALAVATSALSTPAIAEISPLPKIAWYGTLETGLQVAANSNRPILLVSGAPHCHGVPGIW